MANTITISNLPQDLGSVNKNFLLKYIVTDTDESATLSVTEQIDNNIIRTFNVNQGSVNNITIDVTNLNTGNHTLTITASDGTATVSQNVNFFLDSISSNYITKSVRQLRAKINILNFQMQIVDEISGNVLDGNITEDANSDIRRTCDISMVVTNGQFNVQPGGQIWLKIRPSKMY